MVGARVVEPLAIGQDHAEQRAQFEQLMPIAVIARQPGGIEAEHQTGIAQPDLGDQPLEAVSLGARCPDLPRSSSMTRTRSRGQPSPTARSTRRYCSSTA